MTTEKTETKNQQGDPGVEFGFDVDHDNRTVEISIDSGAGDPVSQTVSFGEIQRYVTEQRGVRSYAQVDMDVMDSVGGALRNELGEDFDVDPNRVIVFGVEPPNLVDFSIRPSREENGTGEMCDNPDQESDSPFSAMEDDNGN